MLTPDQLTTLDTKFTARYSKRIAELNRNVIPAALNDNLKYECPATILLGGVLQTKTDDSEFTASIPARVVVRLVEQDRLMGKLEVNLSRDDMEIAINRPEYFAELMDPVLDGVVSRWNTAFGATDKVRYGSFFISTTQLDAPPKIFTQINDEFVAITFYADFAKPSNT